ncbi:sugar porter family MFS transporter [Succinimonas amylolytica]|uniref:sugar porter family MFS transporter n=1 Tax=Succinimonas amylolytica TaxID=83769 RepID=UPI0023A8DDDA
MTNSNSKTVFFVCFMAALAGLLFGIDIGVIAQAKDFIKQDLGVSDNVISWVVGSMMGGATAGALVSGTLTRQLGRKYSLVISATCFVLGALGCALAWNGTVLIIARIIVGISIGVASFTAPLYLSEVAPKSIRGTMITMYQLLITIGILTSFVVNTLIRNNTFTGAEGQIAANFLIPDISLSWRAMLGVTLIPSLIFLAGVFFLPKSPRWLISKGKTEEAKKILLKIRASEDEAASEAQEIINTVSSHTGRGGFAMFREKPNFRKTVYLGITLQLLQQLCGINIIMYFGPELIKAAGYTSEFAANVGTIAIGLTNVLATFIAIAYIDKWGRKPILIAGYSIMAVAMTGVAAFMYFNYSMAAIISVLVFIIAFAFSAGPVVWVLCSEIQPLEGRDFGITCSTGANWLSNMAIAATFLPLLSLLGAAATMLLYAVCSVLAIFLIIMYVPETKGVSLEHLEKNLMNGVKLRDLGK